MNKALQRQFDTSREAFEVVYPRGTTEQMALAFLSSLGGGLRRRPNITPTIVAEVRWTAKDVRHIIRIAPSNQAHVLSMVEAHVPGASVTPVDLQRLSPRLAVDVFMTNANRMLRVGKRDNIETIAVSILHSFQDRLNDGEAVSYQIVLAHTDGLKLPPDTTNKSKMTAKDYLYGNIKADKREVTDRQKKAIEPNFNAAIRIGVQTGSEARARQLIGLLLNKIRNTETNDVKLRAVVRHEGLNDLINVAPTPSKKSAQFTVTELAALFAPPIGDPAVPGLAQGAGRRVAPTEAIPREGRVLGESNMSGRSVALGYDFINRNTIYIGGIGSGKSVGMANNFFDDVSRGLGGIVIDASGSDSAQSLYSRARDYVPLNRIDDVIDIHVRNNAENPVSFDIFKQGLGLGVVDQIVGVFAGLYPEVNTGVTVRELLHHGVWTLMEAGQTLVDLDALLRPKPDEIAWARRVATKMTDPELVAFWDRMRATGWLSAPDSSKQREWERYTDPLFRRLWQLTGRPEIRHMIGQSVTEGEGLNWERALRENKIVLISLAGLPTATAQLIGTLLIGTLWATAQRFDAEQIRYPNALYLDEFQISASIKEMLEDLLARGRKHLLPVTLGTQYITGLPRDIQTAVFNNVMTRIVYPLRSSEEASAWARNMGSDRLTEWDFLNGKPFEPIVQMPTATGSQIVTIRALPERAATGAAPHAVQASRRRYSTPVEEVRERITQRRYTAPAAETSRDDTGKPVGETPYSMSTDDFLNLGRK